MHDGQHEFKLGKSTLPNMLTFKACIVDYVCYSYDILSFDFKKAFEKILLSKVIQKLTNNVMKSSAIKWFSSFLLDRTLRCSREFSIGPKSLQCGGKFTSSPYTSPSCWIFQMTLNYCVTSPSTVKQQGRLKLIVCATDPVCLNTFIIREKCSATLWLAPKAVYIHLAW